MNRKPRTVAVCWIVLSSMASVLLVGCANESTPSIPVPPPFVPATAVVTLGAKGGATTLISTASGGWTHNGQQFSSGDTVRGENAATYRLTLSGDTWSAEFVAPEPARVRLGTSGDEVTLQIQEDGSYQIGATPVQSGDVVETGNGNQYTLTLGMDGTWTAAFLAPDPLRLPLGISGDSVSIEMREDRDFWLDGSQLRSGRVVRAANGNRYTLTFGAEGMWQAVFVQPEPQRVPLGSSGGAVLVAKLENGTYQLDGTPLWAGEVREIANGAKYRYELGTDGLWSATFVPEPLTVPLGAHGGTVRVVRQENGGWTLGGRAVQSGQVVQGSNGHSYRLVLADSAWRAEPQPTLIQVALQGTGGSIVLTHVEDGSYLYDGTAVSSGDVILVSNARYLLTQLAGGGWRAAPTTGSTVPPGRPDPSVPPTIDSLASYVGVSPRARLTDESGTGSREGTIFELNDLEYSVNALFIDRTVDQAVTFAEETRDLIERELVKLEALIFLADTGSNVDADIERRWDLVTGHLNKLFPTEGSALLGRDAPKRRNGGIDYAEVVEDIQDVLAALQTSAAFQYAVEDGIFSGSRRVDPVDSDETFFAVRSSTRLGFGWTAATRYGAYSKLERSSISGTLAFSPSTEGIGSFAYSPLETTRTRELPSSGEAYYFGETIAASRESSQKIYTGDIELRVLFSSKRVTGLVTDLRDEAGRKWQYTLGDVDAIHLPDASLNSSVGSFEPASRGTARVSFSPLSASVTSRTLTAEFEGRFVGRGEQAGEAAIGTWSLRSGSHVTLAGGFGADLESGPTRPAPVVRPPPDPSSDLGEVAATYVGAQPNSSGTISIAALDSDDDRIRLSASELFTNGGVVVAGQGFFDEARKDLETSLALLDLYRIDLDSSTSQELALRQQVWKRANDSLRDNIFGQANVLGASYPSGTSLDNRDEDAVELLAEASRALDSAASFRDAVHDEGIFENILNASKLQDGDYDFEDIFAALEYEVTATYEYTDLTRFGAWAKQVRDNALAAPTAATGDERGDVFAYSPSRQTVYLTTDVNFPKDVTSNYFGRTVAVDLGLEGPQFYDGDVHLSVRWRSSGPTGSAVSMVIENLARTDTGDPLLDSGFEVSSLIFPGASVRLDSQRRVEFSGGSLVRIRYFDPSRSERSSGTGEMEGKFIGYDLSGTRAAFGTWDWRNIKGAFGVELEP